MIAAAVDRHVVGQQPHDGVGRHRLAGAGFANDAEDLVRMRSSSDTSSSACGRSAPRGSATVRCSSERMVVLAHRRFSLGLSASFSPWPTSDTARTVTRIAMPGIADTYHCTRSTSRPSPMRLPQDATLGSERPQERQRAFEQDRDRHHDAGVDDDRRQRVGQDLAEDELDVLHAERPRRPARIRGCAGDRNSARVSRAGAGHDTRPMAMVTVVRVEPNTATSTSSSTKFGRVWNASVIRISTSSTQPP